MTKTKIAVYGASGFTGTLTVAELRDRGVSVVPVGRSRDRLLARGFSQDTVRIAGLDDPDRLAEAFGDVSVVVNCAGPFRHQGEPVVAAAIAAGCHYVDITGEQGYLHRLFEHWAEPAREAGVTVLPAMTDDGAPGDLIATLTAAALADEEEPESILVADLRSGGGVSRGTARSGWVNAAEMDSGGLTYVDGDWRTETAGREADDVWVELPYELDTDFLTEQGFLAEQGPSGLRVRTRPAPLPGVATIPRHLPAGRVRAVIRRLGTELDTAWGSLTAEAIEALPEGPTPEERKVSPWLMLARVSGTHRSGAVGIAYGTDPYGATAAIASEAAVCLAGGDAPAGVLAPSMALDAEDFLNSLGSYGVRWRVIRTPAPAA